MASITLLFVMSICCQAVRSFVQNPVCLLEVDIVPCRGGLLAWYYDNESHSCKQVDSGDCIASANKFDTQIDCEQSCNNPCRLPSDVGPCKAIIPRWYYDTDLKKCQPFDYGGCKGNANNFESQSDCEEICDPCRVPVKVGPCEAAITRWFYNNNTQQCEQFSWGGCQPNENNFLTEEACVEQCDSRPAKKPEKCCKVFCPAGFQGRKNCGGKKKCRCNCPCYECQKTGNKGQSTLVSKCQANETCTVQRMQSHYEGLCKDPRGGFPICPLGDLPLANIFCGRGTTRQDCPATHKCTIDPADRFAVCCLESECDLPPDSGCGDGNTLRWYYNSETGKCKNFRYHGLAGNNNNFASKQDCKDACVKP